MGEEGAWVDGATVHPTATLRQAQVIKGGWGETREVSWAC